jgi:rhodanese-related sulfurtransferase
MTPAELTALMDSSAPHAVLDVRERGAYERGHIFRATSLPRRLLELRVPVLITAPATPIVLYDDDGRLSALARSTLEALGYRDVQALAGGLQAWRAAGRPVVEGVNVPSKVFGEQVLHDFKTPEITPAELEARMRARADMVIVDSRTPEEYARSCVPGAINVPGGELVLRIGELVSRPETTIVVHCGGRTRSYLGAESLRRMRLPNPIVALENGTMGWTLAGFELERGASRWAPPVSEPVQLAAGRVAMRVAAEDQIHFVTPEELQRLREQRGAENLCVLDVRTADEYAAGHIDGAVWAPGGQAVQATDEYIAVRAATIVLACDGQVRSVLTASWLRRMGYPKVRVLWGGVVAWERAGGAMARGHTAALPAGWDRARAAVTSVKAGPLDAETILNVDPSDLYAREHVPGAAWLSRSRLELRIADVVPDRQAALLVTCADGVQSTLAAATLVGLGYTGARVLEGGTRGWDAAGLAVERGATRLLDEPDDVVLKAYDRGREGMVAYLRWEEALDGHGRSPHQLLPQRS